MTDQRNGGIGWTDCTYNPLRGCSKVSPGCQNCYAETMAARFSGPGMPFEGVIENGHWNGKVLLNSHLKDPLHWRKPRRVFVNSVSDVFHPAVDNGTIAAIFGVMAACPQHTFQVVTKRPERAVEWFKYMETADSQGETEEIRFHAQGYFMRAHSDGYESSTEVIQRAETWPLPNVNILTSCENRATADERIPQLLACPAAVRGVSLEPLLGPIDLSRYLRETRTLHLKMDIAGAIRNKAFLGFEENGKPVSRQDAEADLRSRLAAGEKYFPMCDCADLDPQKGCEPKKNPRLDWVIVGCESGPKRRPCNLDWVRSIVDQCRDAGIPVFVKQLDIGGRVVSDMAQFPEWARVRMFPGDQY